MAQEALCIGYQSIVEPQVGNYRDDVLGAMGSTGSREAATSVSRIGRAATAAGMETRARASEKGTAAAKAVSAHVVSHAGVTERTPRSDKWADTLKRISGSISSMPWEVEEGSHSNNQLDEERHSAQRSASSTQKLPQRVPMTTGQDADTPSAKTDTSRKPHERFAQRRVRGRLTQNQVLALFNLRKKDVEQWDAAAVATRFEIQAQDAQDLLNFTRPYVGRMDADGQVRGYYDARSDHTIERFERV